MNLTLEKTQDLNVFQAVEQAVYANDPFHHPSPPQLPANGIGFVALENQQPIACCYAQLQTGNPSLGTIGFFQSLNQPTAATALLKTAIQEIKKQGAKRIVAPMDGDTWHPYRLNTGPFDHPPFIKEPWNPPYYPALLEAAGFVVTETYESYQVDAATAASHQEKFYNRCIKNGYRFEPITAKNYEEILPLIHHLSCRIFSNNTLYTPIDLTEFKRLYRPAKPLLQSGLSWIAHTPDGSPAGYIFTFPDSPSTNSKASRTCMKTLGTIPEKRGSGLTAALTYLSYKNSAELGYDQTLMCLMHSSNDSRRFGGKADRPFRSYALYELIK